LAALTGFNALAFPGPLCSASLGTGSWHLTLTRPAWAPPGWLLGPVWTALYVMMGIAAWIAFHRRRSSSRIEDAWLVGATNDGAWSFTGMRVPPVIPSTVSK